MTRWPRRRYASPPYVIAALAALAVLFSYDRRLAAIFLASAALVFVALRLVATPVMAVARGCGARVDAVRLAIANIHGPGARPERCALARPRSLPAGHPDRDRRQPASPVSTAGCPEKAPSFFFLDIPFADAERRRRSARAGAALHPGARAHACAAASSPRTASRRKTLQARRGIGLGVRGDRGITYATGLPDGSRVVAGEWWGADYAGAPLVSLESKTAADLNL